MHLFVLQVLAGKHVAAKNSTLKKSKLLQSLLAKRNAALQEKLSQQNEPDAPDVLGSQNQEGQEQQQKTKSKKRKTCNLEDMFPLMSMEWQWTCCVLPSEVSNQVWLCQSQLMLFERLSSKDTTTLCAQAKMWKYCMAYYMVSDVLSWNLLGWR